MHLNYGQDLFREPLKNKESIQGEYERQNDDMTCSETICMLNKLDIKKN